MDYKCGNSIWDTKSIEHYKTVQQIKKHLRKENWRYLCKHPEIRAIIRVLIHEFINKKPSDKYEFAAKLFNCKNTGLLSRMINQHLKRVNQQLKKSQWSNFDGEKFFKDIESTHSGTSHAAKEPSPESRDSQRKPSKKSSNVYSLLQFAMIDPET